MPMRMQLVVLLAFVLLSVSLSLLNYQLFYSEIDISPLRDETGWQMDNVRSAPAPAAYQSNDFTALHILERPLFSPTRSEFKVETEPKVAVQKPPQPNARTIPGDAKPSIEFQGTRMLGDKRSAFVVLKGKEDGAWVAIGGQVDGWVVSDIGEAVLTLTSGSRTATYSLYSN